MKRFMSNTVTAILVLLYLVNIVGVANGDTLCIKQDGSVNIEVDCLSDCKEQSCESLSADPAVDGLHMEHHDKDHCLDLVVDNLMRIQRYDYQIAKIYFTAAIELDGTRFVNSKTIFSNSISGEPPRGSAFMEYTFLLC